MKDKLLIMLLLLTTAISSRAQDSIDMYIWHGGNADVRNITQVDSITFHPADELTDDRGADYVDLGLSVKWSSCNLGAAAPEGYGDYYAWGETAPKTSYTWTSYRWTNASNPAITFTKYNSEDAREVLEGSDDAATANWGLNWRIPTEDEWQELSEKCEWTWTTRNGIWGFEIRGGNGNSIFIPAAGYRYGDELCDAGRYGSYWSSSLIAKGSDVRGLDFIEGNRMWVDCYYRYGGLSIRPVHN